MMRAQLDEREKTSAATLDCIREGVAIVMGDAVLDAEIEEHNSAMCDIFDKVQKKGSLKGSTLSKLIEESGGNPASLTTNDGFIMEICISSQNGEVKYCEATFKSIDNKTCGKTRMAVVLRDRTYKKQLELKALELSLTEAAYAATQTQLKWVQHQTKNNVLNMRVVLDNLEKQLLSTDLYHSVMECIGDDFERLRRETEDLENGLARQVMLGELSTNSYTPRFEKSEPHEYVKHLFRKEYDVKTKNLCTLLFDLKALHHLTTNLESNASKYRKSWINTDLSISASHPPIVDGGIVVPQGSLSLGSIPVGETLSISSFLNVVMTNDVHEGEFTNLKALATIDSLKSIFNQGTRVAGKRHASKSAGDGLCLCKNIAIALGGTMWVTLNEENRSISFHVSVPVIKPPSESARGKNSITLKMGICALDDDAIQRTFLKQMLKKVAGVSVWEVWGETIPTPDTISSWILDFKEKHELDHVVFVTDENLSAEPEILGTYLTYALRNDPSVSDTITFIRSGNECTCDIEQYLKVSDGFVRKNEPLTKVMEKVYERNQVQENSLEEVLVVNETMLAIYHQANEILNQFMKIHYVSTRERYAKKWPSKIFNDLHNLKGNLLSLNTLQITSELQCATKLVCKYYQVAREGNEETAEYGGQANANLIQSMYDMCKVIRETMHIV